MLNLLKELITRNPFVDEVDFSNEGIQYFDPHSVDLLGRFTELKKINLSDNEIRKLPNDLSCLNQIIELNLTGNPIENLQLAVESLMTMPVLSSLHINLHQEEEVDFLLRNLPALQVLNGLVVERDAIFSEDEDYGGGAGVNSDRQPLQSSAQNNNYTDTEEIKVSARPQGKQDEEFLGQHQNEANGDEFEHQKSSTFDKKASSVLGGNNEVSTVQSPNPALSYDMEQPPVKPIQQSSAAMHEPTLSQSSPSQCKRLSSKNNENSEAYKTMPEMHQPDQFSGIANIEQQQPDFGGDLSTGCEMQQNQSNSALVSAVVRNSGSHAGNQSGHTVAASIQANIQHESTYNAIMSSSDHLAPLFSSSYDNRHQIHHISNKSGNMIEENQDGDPSKLKLAVSSDHNQNNDEEMINYVGGAGEDMEVAEPANTDNVFDEVEVDAQQRFVTSCHTQQATNNPTTKPTGQTTTQLIFSQQSQGDRQSENAINNKNGNKVNYNRSSLLVLSSSKEDDDDRVQSQLTSGPPQVVDPKTLIQFKELEQESFSMSRQGGQDNLLQQQLSAGDTEVMINFTRRAEHQLDMLSLDDGCLRSSNLLKSVPKNNHVDDNNNNMSGSYGQVLNDHKNGKDQHQDSSKKHNQLMNKLASSELLHQMQQQHDSSSVDTELEVSINNAHLLTNLAKAVQEKERNDKLLGSEQQKQQQVQANSAKSKESLEKGQTVELQEDLWLFAYEEQAEQACAQHDTEGKQKIQREQIRNQKQYPTQGLLLDNLIRDATSLAQLSSDTVFSPQVEDLIAKVKQNDCINCSAEATDKEAEDDAQERKCSSKFEQRARNKSQLLNVAFGSILHYMKEGQCSQELSNVIGLIHWFSAGLLEGSLRAYEHLKEKQTAFLEQQEQKHQLELSRLQSELQDVLEAAETFEKQAQSEAEQREKASENLTRERQDYEEQLVNLQEENKKLLDTLIRHSKDRANKSINQSSIHEPVHLGLYSSNHTTANNAHQAAPSASIQSEVNSNSIYEPESHQQTSITAAGLLTAQNVQAPGATQYQIIYNHHYYNNQQYQQNHNNSSLIGDIIVDGDVDSQSNAGCLPQQNSTLIGGDCQTDLMNLPQAQYQQQLQNCSNLSAGGFQNHQNHFKAQTPLSNISHTDGSIRHFNNDGSSIQQQKSSQTNQGPQQRSGSVPHQQQPSTQLTIADGEGIDNHYLQKQSNINDEVLSTTDEMNQDQQQHQQDVDQNGKNNCNQNNQSSSSWSYAPPPIQPPKNQVQNQNGSRSNSRNSFNTYTGGHGGGFNSNYTQSQQQPQQFNTQPNNNNRQISSSHYDSSMTNQQQFSSAQYYSANRGHYASSNTQHGQSITIGQKLIPIKQLRDIIADIYNQKLKFDAKSRQSGLPVETMEQFMYTYLVQKYGLKSLIVEWATAIINGVRAYSKDDHEVALFAKVLKNECDEEFRYIQVHVRNTMEQVLKAVYRDKNPLKSEKDLNSIVDKLKKHNGTGQLEEAIWKKLILKMYDEQDSQNLILKVQELIEAKREAKENEFSANFFARGINQSNISNLNNLNNLVGGMQPTRKLTREQENAKRKQIKLESRVRFQELSDLILEYQLIEHENFLSKFTQEFKQVDSETLGVLNEHQFKLLISNMHQVCEGGLFSFEQDVDAEIEELLEGVDPQNNQRITYSEIVQLLSQRTVPCYPNNEITVAVVTQEARQMPILEKFVQYAAGNPDYMILQNQKEDTYSEAIDDSQISRGIVQQNEAVGADLFLAEQEINRRLSQVSNSNQKNCGGEESVNSSSMLQYGHNEEDQQIIDQRQDDIENNDTKNALNAAEEYIINGRDIIGQNEHDYDDTIGDQQLQPDEHAMLINKGSSRSNSQGKKTRKNKGGSACGIVGTSSESSALWK